jgi:hypothetical protein
VNLSLEEPMHRRIRVFITALSVVIVMAMSVTPVSAESYTSTISNFWNTLTGQCRTYHGTSIHIQLDTTANGSGTYGISVYKCVNGAKGPQVGGEGSCPYPGFCGYGWSINLGGSQYLFYFRKTGGDYHDIINSNNVQMWST